MAARVLVVDDEDVGRQTLAEILRLEGFEVSEASGGRQALAALAARPFEVMLLDLKMPDLDGVSVLEQAATLAPSTRVIVFTAHGSLDSAIQAVRRHAADYLLKPTASEDVLAVVRRVVAEAGAAPGLPAGLAGRTLHAGELALDLDTRRLRGSQSELVLTPAEARLFAALHAQRGRVVGHAELVRQVQGYAVESWEAPAMLRPVISRLREKVREAGGPEDWIATVRGAGYLMPEA